MSISEKIYISKSKLIASQRDNVTAELLNIYDELKTRANDKHFALTIPVSIVSANESFFKEAVSSLINFDKKHLENSAALIKKSGTKFELEELFHLSKSYFSLGDLISYNLKYSSIESILKSFCTIAEIDILKELDGIKDELLELNIEDLISERRPFDKARVIKNLKEVYEIRNIICHDFLSTAHKLKINIGNLSDYLLDCALLQYATVLICSNKIYSARIPVDYEERKKFFQKEVDSREKELGVIYNEIRSSLKSEVQKQNLEANIEAFESFLNNDVTNIGRTWFCGSDSEIMFEDLGLEHKIKLLDQRIKILKDEINSS